MNSFSCFFGFCEPLQDFKKVCSRSRDSQFVWNRPPEAAWVPMRWEGRRLREPVACAPMLRVGRTRHKDCGFRLHPCLGPRRPSSPRAEARLLSASRPPARVLEPSASAAVVLTRAL